MAGSRFIDEKVYDNDGALIGEWDDTARTYTDHTTVPPTTRPYTAEENIAAEEHFYKTIVAPLEERVSALEARMAALHPQPENPETDDPNVKTMAEWGGVWPVGGFLKEGDIIYKNVSGVALTTAPSGFPGDPSLWTAMFIVVVGENPDPDPEPEPGAEPWVGGNTYAVNDLVTHNGKTWKCMVAHTNATWAPGVAHSVWQEVV